MVFSHLSGCQFPHLVAIRVSNTRTLSSFPSSSSSSYFFFLFFSPALVNYMLWSENERTLSYIDVMLSISPTMHGSPAQRGLGNNRPWYSFRMENTRSLTPILTYEVHNTGSNCPTIFTGFTLPRELSLYMDTQYEFFQ